MSDKPKRKCPFCGSAPYLMRGWWWCKRKSCALHDVAFTAKEWDKRPSK